MLQKKFRKVIYLKLRNIKCRLIKLKYGLSSIHNTSMIGSGCDISKDLIAHEYVYIGPDCIIGPGVEIGSYTMLGPRIVFAGDDHLIEKPGTPMIFSGRPLLRKTIIGRDVWIGANAVIMSGVTIRNGAVVAAGSVVTKDVPECEVHGGIPNKKIKDRFNNQQDKIKHLSLLKRKPFMGEFCGSKEGAG